MNQIDLTKVKAPIIPDSNKIGSNYKKEIALFSPDEFESFIFEWVKFCKYKNQQVSVYKIGSTGDHGIDIAVFNNGIEEVYQCKRYEKPLNESQLKTIIVKILWYYFIDFNGTKYPSLITISTIKGFSVKAIKVFEKKNDLKKEILKYYNLALDNENIKYDSKVLLQFKKYVDLFDFKKVIQTDIDDIIKDYINSEMKFFRFRDVRPNFSRLDIDNIQAYPDNYVTEITNVIKSTPELSLTTDEISDFINDAKNEFYSAVTLRETCFYFFSETREFEKIEDSVNTLMNTFKFKRFNNKFERMNEILIAVNSLDLNDSYLQYGMHMVNYKDRKGTCHWLVNNGKFSWEK